MSLTLRGRVTCWRTFCRNRGGWLNGKKEELLKRYVARQVLIDRSGFSIETRFAWVFQQHRAWVCQQYRAIIHHNNPEAAKSRGSASVLSTVDKEPRHSEGNPQDSATSSASTLFADGSTFCRTFSSCRLPDHHCPRRQDWKGLQDCSSSL